MKKICCALLILMGTAVPISAAASDYELFRVLKEPTGYVNSLAFSPDGSFLFVASDDGGVTQWSAASGEPMRVWNEGRGAVYSVAISPDGRMLAMGGLDETIRLRELSSGRELASLKGHDGWINAVAFTPDGRELVSAGRDSSVRIWEVSTGKNLRAMKDYPSEVFALAVSPDGRLLASDKGDSFSIRDLATGREVADGAPGQWGITTLGFAPGSDELLTSGYDGKLWSWAGAGNRVVSKAAIGGGPVISIAIRADGLLLAALCSGDKTVKVFDTRSWIETGHLDGISYPTGSVAFSADGRYLAAGGGDSPVRVWRRRDAR